MTDNTKPAPVKEYSEEFQREVNRYHNGSLQDAATGHWLKPGEGKILTSEQGRQLSARRRELAQARALEGIDEAIAEGSINISQVGGGEGWKHIVKHVASTLIKSSNLRGQAEAAAFLGKAAGITERETGGEDIAVNIARLFEKFMDRLPREEVIEGTVKDG